MVSQSLELAKLFSENPLFKGLNERNVTDLIGLISERRYLAAEDYLIKEGDRADEIFVIEKGHIEILVQEKDSETSHAVATLGTGECVGEIALIDRGQRSASAKAMEDVTVLVIPLAGLDADGDKNIDLGAAMKINMAEMMANRMRTTNEGTVENLRTMLDESEKRVEMGKFMSRVLIGTCLYLFALGGLKTYSNFFGDTTFITVPVILCFAGGLYFNIKLSIYPASDYGFTTRNWKPAVREALIYSVPFFFLCVLAKWIMVQTLPSMEGKDIFDFYRSNGTSFGMTLAAFAAYASFAPVQEMIARSGMQSSFQMFLSGKNKTWIAIFLSTLFFSSIHLHVSFVLALLVFPAGLFWGWLYSRNPTLIGPALSHVLIGSFGMFIVGFPLS